MELEQLGRKHLFLCVAALNMQLTLTLTLSHTSQIGVAEFEVVAIGVLAHCS